MRSLAIALALAAASMCLPGGGTAHAREPLVIPPVAYPDLPEFAGGIFDFIPEGWVLEAHAEGDLNRDGRDDTAGVLRMRDPANILPNPLLGGDPFDSNPRILVVALRVDPARYRLVLADHDFIPRREIPDLLDHFQSIAIERGTLVIGLEHFMSAGGWTTWSATYRFRWWEDQFLLIGYDRREIARNTGEVEELSINYLIRRRKIVTRQMEDDRQEVAWRVEPRRRLWRLSQIGNGLDWHPDPARRSPKN